MVNYTPPTIDYAKVRKSLTIPDQSLSIQEIVKRYVRGIPVDVVQRKAVYIDQHEADLEKLSRADFGEKAEYANMFKQQAAEQMHSLEEQERSRSEAIATKAKAEADAAKAAEQKAGKQPPA